MVSNVHYILKDKDNTPLFFPFIPVYNETQGKYMVKSAEYRLLFCFRRSAMGKRSTREKSAPHPDEILAMGRAYKKPQLCNYYCSNGCPLGHEVVPEIEMKELTQITLEMLASLNSIESDKNRLIEITSHKNVFL